jgi:hypothetical protein
VVGATYRLSGWVRASGPPPDAFDPDLQEFTADDVEVGEEDLVEFLPISADWEVFAASYLGLQAGTHIEVHLKSDDAPDDSCIELDDLCLIATAEACATAARESP